MVIEQRTLSNIRFGDDVGIWEGSIVFEVLYLMFKVKAIVGFVVGFLVVVAIFIEVSSGRYRLGMGGRSRGLMNPLKDRFSYAWVRVIPRSENSQQAFFG